ncbi:hypothetical protein D3C73_185530 [compost metagenome]
MSSFDYKKSTITRYRSGNSDDPYIDITEQKKIINGQILLNEIPVLSNKVRITDYFEVPNSNTKELSSNEYRVDYIEGIVKFNPSEEGKEVVAIYKGKGNHYISISRVWTKEENGEVVETLGDIIETGNEAIGNIQTLAQLMTETENAKNETIIATNNANQAANSVYSSINEANEVIEDVLNTNILIEDAERSRINAENERINNELIRKENETNRLNNESSRIESENNRETNELDRISNEEFRKQQEIQRETNINNIVTEASQSIDDVQSVINNTKGFGNYESSKIYKKNNIISYNGSSYLALEDNLYGILPTDSSKWQLIAQRGVDGNGSVISVNSISPNPDGNIVLLPENLGAETANKKGLANGYAGLNQDGVVPYDQLPLDIETKEGSQLKAETAEINAKNYFSTFIEDRLDTADSDPVTLQPGLQVVNSAKDTRFKLDVIKGKTEINGQGRVGIIGVENPYVIATSGNPLPPFYEWGVPEGSPKIKNPYSVEVSNVNKIEIALPVIGGQTYNLSVKSSAVSGRLFVRYNTETVIDITGSAGELKGTFIAPQGAKEVAVRLLGTSTDSVIMSDIMVYVGIEVKPFKPQRKSMLAFQAELHANPTDGSDPDVLFEHGGQYNKLAKWKKVVLDGSLKYGYFGSVGNAKVVYVDSLPAAIPSTPQGVLTKYNGAQLINNLEGVAGWPGADVWQMGASGYNVLYLSISNADSGWGPNYTPTQDEIKAYFSGWRMFLLGQWTNIPYDGTGTKAWVRITDTPGGAPEHGYQTTVPNYSYIGFNPYNLLYRFSKEIVEPVVFEGCLTLTEGDNTVEVGTGIVLRERANPNSYSSVSNINDQASKLSKPTNSILRVYRDSDPDFRWSLLTNSSGYGGAVAQLTDLYDQSAAYSVTYIKLDKSPITPVTGALSANEKAQISDLTAGVAEALQRVSVVEQKKAEKDAPGWIAPTLLNGWANIVGSNTPAGYFRDTMGFVHLRGSITGGISTPWTVIFKLPTGYRPKYNNMIPTYTNDSSGTQVLGSLSINNSGDVQIYIGAVGNFSLDGITFLAEQ